MKKRLSELMERAGGISHRNFVMIAACSLIATAAVIGGALNGSGFSAAAALAAALEANPAAAAASDAAAGDTSVPDLESATLGPGGPTAGPSAGPSDAPPPADDGTTTPTEPTDPTTPEPPPPPPPAAGPFGHVFVISLTSPGYDAAFGEQSQMPYLSESLRPQGALLSGYELLDDKAMPNVIGMTGGQRPNAATKGDCSTYAEFPSRTKPDDKGFVPGDGCIYPAVTLSVADQVAATGRSWRGYIEGMADETGPANCVRPTPNEADETEKTTNGVYAARHNPFIYYHSLLDLGSCTAGDIPGDQLVKDLKSESTTPAYSYIAPNLCHSGVERACNEGPDGAAAADEYLSELVPKILKSAAYKKDGLLIVTFDELAASAQDDDGTVGTVAVSGLTTPGATLTGKYDPYSLLRSTEDGLGLTPLASAAKADSFADDIVNGGD